MRTRYEHEIEKKNERKRDIAEIALVIFLIAVSVVAFLLMPKDVEGFSADDAYALEEAQKPHIRYAQIVSETDPDLIAYKQWLKEQETAEPEVPEWEVSDTAELDSEDDNFEWLVAVTFAEAGNQPERGVRWVVDTVGERAGWDMSKVYEVITAKYQFSSYPNGIEKWRDHITEEFIQIVADEWMAETKACGNNKPYFFRTGHYSQYGTPICKIGDHYFSAR